MDGLLQANRSRLWIAFASPGNLASGGGGLEKQPAGAAPSWVPPALVLIVASNLYTPALQCFAPRSSASCICTDCADVFPLAAAKQRSAPCEPADGAGQGPAVIYQALWWAQAWEYSEVETACLHLTGQLVIARLGSRAASSRPHSSAGAGGPGRTWAGTVVNRHTSPPGSPAPAAAA